jgi:hypothetical protein
LELQHTTFAAFAPYTAIALILMFQSESGKPRNAGNHAIPTPPRGILTYI